MSDFNFDGFSEVFDEANKGARDNSIPVDLKEATDSKEVEVVKMGRGTMKVKDEEVPKIWAALRLVDGTFAGKTVFKNWPITGDPTQLRYALTDWKTMGLGIEKMDDLNNDEKLATVYGNRLAVSIYKTTSRTNGKEYGNMKIQRRLSTASENA